MKKEHFIDRVKNSILDYLPEEFRDAEILVREVVKVPAGKRTGLCVRKKDRVVSAVLYLEPYYEKVEEDGIPLGCVLQEIADGIIQAGLGEEQALKVADRVRDYDWVSEHLVIQMFDRDEVQETLDGGLCVAVSMYSPNVGEAEGVIYGYTPDGDLLVADPGSLKAAGTIHITEYAMRMMGRDGQIGQHTWFEWEGLGFDSLRNGDRIVFGASSASSELMDLEAETEGGNS